MNPVDFKSALDGVDTTTIVLPIVGLTLPFAALARGLKKVQAPRRGGGRPAAAAAAAAAVKPGGKKSKLRLLPAGLLQRLWARLLGLLTVAAWAVAGLGLVPLGLVIYKALSKTSPWTPLGIAVVLVVILGATVLKMVKDLKDGRVDKPALWFAAAPVVAVLVLVGPGLWQQTKDQAHHSAQMMIGKAKPWDHVKTTHHPAHKAHHGGSGK